MALNTDDPFGLYAPIPDADAYLRRIGFAGTVRADLKTLNKLIDCHLSSVPFENLDVFHRHAEPRLDTQGLFEKIVTQRRGGYCFELNGLFGRLLEQLGFHCTPMVARIQWHYAHLTPPSHQVNVVEIDGIRYFCDVGFGGPIPRSAIPIRADEIQICPASGRRYRFAFEMGEITVLTEFEEGFKAMLTFLDRPCSRVDFLPLNTFCAYSPIEPFIHKQMVWLAHPEGRRSLDGDVLKVEKYGHIFEQQLTSDHDLRDALLTWFDIDWTDPFENW